MCGRYNYVHLQWHYGASYIFPSLVALEETCLDVDTILTLTPPRIETILNAPIIPFFLYLISGLETCIDQMKRDKVPQLAKFQAEKRLCNRKNLRSVKLSKQLKLTCFLTIIKRSFKMEEPTEVDLEQVDNAN